MIGVLRGNYSKHSETGRWILEVGSAETAVGYIVSVPSRYEALPIRSVVELFIHTHVREDQLDLYGFLDTTEKKIFEVLIQMSGIGPKTALQILSSTEPESIIRAVLEKNKERLVGLPGVGKKTAERMMVELPDLVKKYGLDATPLPQRRASGAENLFSEVHEALVQLGFSHAESKRKIEAIQSREPLPSRVEEWVKFALQETSR